MSFRSEVSSGASRPGEAMVGIYEIESAMSSAELKTSKTITETDLLSHFEVLDSNITSGLKKIITKGSRPVPGYDLKQHQRVDRAICKGGRQMLLQGFVPLPLPGCFSV